jgi:glucosamine-6-phosphate deaminase
MIGRIFMGKNQQATPYRDLDSTTRAALRLSRSDLSVRLRERARIYQCNEDMIADMAETILADYQALQAEGRDQVAMIVPVGPVGQYPILARLCVEREVSLDRLTLFIMDEYLTDDGAWIPETDPLSFRAHMWRNLLDLLPDDMRPALVVPDPTDPGSVGRMIKDLGGVDLCYAGVGITGHLAFNEPLAGEIDPAYFAALPTRIVPLLPETRLINSVTAARGNVARIPRMAVTVGMKEILGARKLRIFMNRHWQSAAIRRLVAGPVTAAFPASLAQGHADWTLHVVDHVLDAPEPELA